MVKAPMESFILAMAEEFRTLAPELLATPKSSAYRIYRDTRFSSDKTPYKTQVAAVFPPRGLGKHEGACLYVHIAPDEVFVGGGLYMPARPDLQAVREHLAENHRRLRARIRTRAFRDSFGELGGAQLSRVPRGFPSEHPAADLLRHKQFLASKQFEPGLAMTPEFQPEVVRTFTALLPMVRFLNEPILERRAKSLQELSPGS